MIRAQRSTGLILLGISVFVSTIPTHAQLVKSTPQTTATGNPANTAAIRLSGSPEKPTLRSGFGHSRAVNFSASAVSMS